MLASSADDPLPFRVLLDGEPPGTSHGVDVDEDGHGELRAGRLYQLVRQRLRCASGRCRSPSPSAAPGRTRSPSARRLATIPPHVSKVGDAALSRVEEDVVATARPDPVQVAVAAAAGSRASGSAPHPFDPLAPEEIAQAVAVIREAEGASLRRFVRVRLTEPAKAAYLAWLDGGAMPPRQADVALVDGDASRRGSRRRSGVGRAVRAPGRRGGAPADHGPGVRRAR